MANGLIEKAGPHPRTWILCRGHRIAAVIDRQDGRRMLVSWSGDLPLFQDGLWRFFGPGNRISRTADGQQHVVAVTPPPPPQPVPVTHIDCRQHGQHPVDGTRLARHVRAGARRLDISELKP
jgi:hypothetical protein